MNQIININLGGYPINIDQDAYNYLDTYIESLESYFGHTDGGDEILTDIESRVAELFKENTNSQGIVTRKNIDEVIAIMGTPEDIKSNSTQGSEGKPSSASYNMNSGRRLFRDPEDKIIGGVCAGLAQYFGIQDPVWVRAGFALISLAGGSGVLAYILLWIIVPPARTTSDRLAMKGEPINIHSISDKVRQELSELGEIISDFKKKR